MYFDVVISTGSTAAISSALTLRELGLSVCVLTHRTYLGEDICAPLRLRLPEDMDLSDPLVARLYGEAASTSEQTVRPMQLKHTLDQVLAEADIPVMFGSYVVDVSMSSESHATTLTVHNRSGQRSLNCRALLDGSLQADLAHLTQQPLTDPDDSFPVIRRVLGGDAPVSSEWIQEADVALTVQDSTRILPLWAHHSTATLADSSWASWAELEQQIRETAYRPSQELSADTICAFSGERLHPSSEPVAAMGDFTKVPVSAVTISDRRLWLTGPAVNVDAPTRLRIQRHDDAIVWGKQVATLLADSLGENTSPVDSDSSPTAKAIQPISTMTVDVLVVGGGTGGAPAAISAARTGAQTLCAEFLSGLGGVGTLGLIGRYWFGFRDGFTAEIDAGAASLTGNVNDSENWDVEAKMQWYHTSLSQAAGAVWYQTTVCGALTEGSRVTGAVLATPRGPIAVQANCVVDATGSGAVAAAAGADTVPIGDGHLALQGTGLPGRTPGKNYGNTDYDFIDESNADDLASAHVTARQKFKNDFDAGQLVDSRERSRIVGDYEITPMDIRLARVFPDTICRARSNFDTHGFTVHPLFMIVPPDHEPREAHIPLRALLPKGLDGILVTGLGISAQRDAMPVIRMQADVQNQGFAAGMIAGLAKDGHVRALNLDVIQSRLAEAGVIPSSLRGAPDSFPISSEEIDRSLAASVHDLEQIDRVFTLSSEERLTRIQRAYNESSDEVARQHFAFVLGILGDATGVETLASVVANTPWDKGWDYTGMGQFGASMSPLDARIIALGRCGSSRDLDTLHQKAAELPADAAFSHYRALSEALQTLGDASSAPVLEALLQRDGIMGHHLHSTADRLATATANSTETSFRNAALIELTLASALYQLSPESTLGCNILKHYARDLRGLFAKHAQSLLSKR